MRKITKGDEPTTLTQWKRANPRGRYADLTHEPSQSIRQACIEEQYGLCAYCCHEITADNARNEHVQAQKLAPNRTVDFSNIVASCDRLKQCDKAHGHQVLPLTPLMDECETELKFYISGRVEGLTPRATTSIQVLNLGNSHENNRALINARKTLVEALLYEGGVELKVEDSDLLILLMEELSAPDANNRLKPFAPVLVNVIRHLTA
ncbi:TIGR02646 family protein [Pseudomonas fluorescens]|uniref:TIGR02646 family protein n=1 Tax=Pseudomonas fluorescens TaxID=294 RepID=UPI001907394E|nr:TIGR02646 family protein [Pseudomonas fluorescens]MBD8716441.1 TIGR02646 family protein [Pseudomonas fluorescens]